MAAISLPLLSGGVTSHRHFVQIAMWLLAEITLDELAVIAAYSKWQVTRDFRALYGTTPYRYIVLKRLQKAKTFIVRGLPLAEVAVSTGFADSSHLTRQFKQCVGTDPKLWAQLHRFERSETAALEW